MRTRVMACDGQKDCSACNKLAPACAWCGSSGTCVPATYELKSFVAEYSREPVVYNMQEYKDSYGVSSGIPGLVGDECLIWVTDSSKCSVIEKYCSHTTECDDCLKRAGCGFCAPTVEGEGQCVSGSSSGQMVMSSKRTTLCHSANHYWLFGNWPKWYADKRWANVCPVSATVESVSRPSPTPSVSRPSPTPSGSRPRPSPSPSRPSPSPSGLAAGGIEPSGPRWGVDSRAAGRYEDDDDGDPNLVLYIIVAVVGVVGACLVYCLIGKVLRSNPERPRKARSDKDVQWSTSTTEAADNPKYNANSRETDPEPDRVFRSLPPRTAATSAVRAQSNANSRETVPESDRVFRSVPPAAATSTARANGARSAPATAYGRDAAARAQADVQSPRDIKIEMGMGSPRDAQSGKGVGSPRDTQNDMGTGYTRAATAAFSARQRGRERERDSGRERDRAAREQFFADAADAAADKARGRRRDQAQSQPPMADSSTPKPYHQFIVPPPVGLPACARESAQIVYETLLSSVKASDAERRAVFRELQRSWHPDKHSEERKEMTTAVFQYISSVGSRFLKGESGTSSSV